jgi:hypothetical protein
VTAADEQVQTYTWRARGFTEDITVCDFCGRQELKGTVRMVSVDADGDEGDEMHAGVVCAAKRAGRKAEEIRHEAKAADAARRAARNEWTDRESNLTCQLRDEWLAERGMDLRKSRPGFAVISEALDAAKTDPRMVDWLAENPRPV